MPIGPLAIALRHANASRRQIAILAIAALALLALGIGILLL